LPVDEFDTLILAVAHDEFKEMDMTKILKRRHVIFDVKGILDRELVDGRL
jgi:putative UDP-glucose-6 dehydrogenase